MGDFLRFAAGRAVVLRIEPFGLVPAPQGIHRSQDGSVVTEVSGAEAARPIEGMKKAEAIAAAAVKLDGKRWLPSTLRAYEVPATVEEDDADKDGSED